ncbi:MAG TPA: alpha-1,4-glucan--maltose-1-phosphate maltosyltransferase [Acetobacteraceae bacterium]|nr:alpha-1,4-glucan--maltose-1-phosphate maltosyltransferase [Acetobacteraceae bacterium]
MAPKIYHLHPLVAGPLNDWSAHFARCRAMGFDTVLVAPPFVPGASGDIYVTADHESLHPALAWGDDADAGINRISRDAAKEGLRVWLDLAIDQVAIDATVRRHEERWFAPGGCSAPPSPLRAPYRLDIAYAQLHDTEVAAAVAAWWLERLTRLVNAGISGFRCLDPDHAPASLWRQIIGSLNDCSFLAWTPGLNRAALPRLEGVGFSHVCSSLAWWDARADWFIEEMELLRRIAPAVASPEPSFFDRRAGHVPAGGDVAADYRFALRLAAASASGMLIPMGFEFAAKRPFDAALGSPADLRRARDEAPCDLSSDIAAANALVDEVAADRADGEMRRLSAVQGDITALLRSDAPDIRNAERAILVLANPDLTHQVPLDVPISPLPPQAGTALMPESAQPDADAPMEPGEVRVLSYVPTRRIIKPLVSDRDIQMKPLAAARVGIEAVSPQVPYGAFAVKRLVGDIVTVSADIIADGHDVLAAEVQWATDDESDWHRVPMRLVNNDRWQASFVPARVGRHRYTVRAWWDAWGTFRHDLSAKHAAGQTVTLEIAEGRALIEAAIARTSTCSHEKLAAVIDRLPSLDAASQVALLLSDDTAAAMRAVDDRPFAIEHTPSIALDVQRPQAEFASWYEMFPRSATTDPSVHGTFKDVIARLPAIRAMGFDVLYFPPIHPIGTTNRKGRNNALRAAPEDVGSPYAIGGPEGGYDAVHPRLGTLDDFRTLVAAAKDNGLELALDFAVQCSPDHPWLRQHPDWFRWRPDGSIRFAENPPKKYEDIVNPDFYAKASMPGLWFALRDAVQFWVDRGVRIFRVDNPHTKPLPFWQWMIADITGRYPDVIFLAEAFTRPKLMYRLAKLGFTQSYTYFTWRNTKQEITEYLTELNTPPVRDFFRPNFFVNTPDINPPFLQTSGRPGFLIRAALACTLSGLWGMYSGFEICESAPLPGREEYLDSEKYEIRVRDFSAPGNIVAEISALNRIRRAHAALQTHLGLTFYPAFNEQVLLYGKRTPGARDMILVAVSLDPHAPQEAAIEVPLWEWGLPDDAALAATDLMRGNGFVWNGKQQRIRLDPADLPFAIWRISPVGAA